MLAPLLAMRQEEERRIRALEAVQKKLGVQVPLPLPAAVAAPGAPGTDSAGPAADGSGAGAAGAMAAFDDGGRDVGGRCAGEEAWACSSVCSAACSCVRRHAQR